jgi:hypothetical protein
VIQTARCSGNRKLEPFSLVGLEHENQPEGRRSVEDENRQNPSEKRDREAHDQGEARGAENQDRLHGVEPDEAIVWLGGEEHQAGQPAQTVAERTGDILVEAARGFLTVHRFRPLASTPRDERGPRLVVQ